MTNKLINHLVPLATLVLIAGCNGDESQELPSTVPETSTAQYQHFEVKEDSWVRRSRENNYGDDFMIYLNKDDSGNDNWFADGVMKFDIKEIADKSTIERVELVFDIFFVRYNPMTMDVFVIDGEWEENTVNGLTKLERKAHLDRVLPPQTNYGLVNIDITQHILETESDVISVLITGEESPSEAVVRIRSRHIEDGLQRAPHLSVVLKPEFVEQPQTHPDILTRYENQDYSSDFYLNDWSLAGIIEPVSQETLDALKVFSVDAYGAQPNNENVDNIAAVQAAIDAAQENGGGIVSFGKGTYHFNLDSVENAQALYITQSNIILRGQGSDTVLRQHHSMIDSELVATRTPHLINIFGDTKSKVSNVLLVDTQPGDTQILVNDRVGFTQGDLINISHFNKDGSISAGQEVIYPLLARDPWTNFGRFVAMTHINRIKQVQKVSDGTLLTLEARLPYGFKAEYAADIRLVEKSINHSGVENLTVSMEMPEGYTYTHSSPEPLAYRNAAIKLENVANSWVKNVEVENFTQSVTLGNSHFNHIDNVTLSTVGGGGHHGIGLYRSSQGNLVSNISMNAYMSHHISFNSNSNGNVITNVSNPNLKHPTMIDFHGAGLPSFNLVEASSNIYVQSSGSTFNMPHAGTRNTFWNLETRGGEFFPASSGWNSDSDYDSNGFDHYMLHPRSIMVGLRSERFGTMMEKQTQQHSSDWYYLETYNEGAVTPDSLYEFQRGFADSKKLDN
ncbi:CBM96 family carbohydrate-binding protein [Vibrio agarivorans]|uniref:CBM96 family carbohydrate-binding protein n=1 Tax=Vibrio agarivorans TaxID=153622 RepID=UPI0022318A5C|nr:glycosyl hydrolase family 28-related protein [Vibrio agarivorans]